MQIKSILTVPFLYSIVFICCQPAETEHTKAGPSEFLPSVFIDTVGSWSGDYSKDSLLLLELYSKFDFYSNKSLYDSTIQAGRAIISLGEPLLEARYDSSLYEKYADAFDGIGYSLTEMGRFDEGMKYLKTAFEKIKERFGENHIRSTEICVGIAVNYLYRGDTDHALEYIHKSLHICNQVFEENHRYFGNNYGNLAYIYTKRGEFEKAIHYIKKEIENRKIIHKYGQYWTSPILKLTECYLELQDIEAAENVLEEGFSVLLATPDYEKHIFTLYLAAAKLHIAKGEFEKARDAATKFIQHYSREAGSHEGTPVQGDGHFLLAQIEQKLGHSKLAEDYFMKALESWDAHFGFSASLQISALLEIAKLKEHQGEYEPALEYVRQALERTLPAFSDKDLFALPQLEGLSASMDIIDILTQKTSILWKAYHDGREEKFLFAVWESTQKIINYMQEAREGFHSQDSKIALSQKAVPVVEMSLACVAQLWTHTSNPAYLEEAYRSIEKVKSIVLLENLNTTFALNNTNIPQEILDYEDRLLNDLGLYNRLILEETQKGTTQDSLKLHHWHNKRLTLKESHDSLVQVLKESYPGFYHLKQNLPISSIADVQKFLRKGEVLVNYFIGDSTLTVFSASRDRFFFHHIPWTSAQEKSVEQYVSFMNQPISEWNQDDIQTWEKAGNYLFRLLLPDWRHFPSPTSLIVIPDGNLGYLPFHLLLTVEPKDIDFRDLPYLLKSSSVRYQFSSTLLIHPFKPLRKAKIEYAGFAPQYQGRELVASRSAEDSIRLAELYPELVRDGLSNLAFNRPEVEVSSSLWKGSTYLGPLATENNFKETGPDAKILHLAMHALTNDEEPLLSQLVFSLEENPKEDGKLHNYELQNLVLSADLTVLSACNTGSGKLRRGEGVMSVSRAFRLAGCPNIVMSLWQANDLSTGQIVTHFFRNLKKGHGKAKALQESSLHFLQTADERYTHPFYWGNMMLIGDDEPIRPGLPFWIYGLGTLVILSLLGWGISKRRLA